MSRWSLVTLALILSAVGATLGAWLSPRPQSIATAEAHLQQLERLIASGDQRAALAYAVDQATVAQFLAGDVALAVRLRERAMTLSMTSAQRLDNGKRLAGALALVGRQADALATVPEAAAFAAGGESPSLAALYRAVLGGPDGDGAVDVHDPAAPLLLLGYAYLAARAGQVDLADERCGQGLALLQRRARSATAAELVVTWQDEVIDRDALLRRLETSRSGIHATDEVKQRIYAWVIARLGR